MNRLVKQAAIETAAYASVGVVMALMVWCFLNGGQP